MCFLWNKPTFISPFCLEIQFNSIVCPFLYPWFEVIWLTKRAWLLPLKEHSWHGNSLWALQLLCMWDLKLFLLVACFPQFGQVYCKPVTWTSMCSLIWCLCETFSQSAHFHKAPFKDIAGLFLSDKPSKCVSMWVLSKAML